MHKNVKPVYVSVKVISRPRQQSKQFFSPQATNYFYRIQWNPLTPVKVEGRIDFLKYSPARTLEMLLQRKAWPNHVCV